MKAPDSSASFQLSTGGLVYSLLLRVHAQEPNNYHVKRRILLFWALTWLPLLLLAGFEGNLINDQLTISFASDLKPYVRFLVTLPLLIVADVLIDPLIAAVITSIRSSGILPNDRKEAFDRAFDLLDRRNDSRVADVVIVLIVGLLVAPFIAGSEIHADTAKFNTWISGTDEGALRMTLAGWWFQLVSSPLLLTLLFRWLWRFFIWCEFMFRVSRIELALEPTHPDLAGGLGILRNSHNAFLIILFAFGTMLSVSLAQEIQLTDATLTMAQPVVLGFIVACLVLTTFPLLFFTPQLIVAKRRGRITYGALGTRLSRAFDEKWATKQELEIGKQLLETADSSSVCDYSTVYEVVKNMRFIPVSVRQYGLQAIALLVPFVPLVLIEMPFSEVLRRLSDTLL